MCGISVFFHKQSLSIALYERFLASMHKIDHRGPDDEGVVLVNTDSGNYKIIRTPKTHSEITNTCEINDVNITDYNLILGHKRLSIIDLSTQGHQPMQNKDNSWIVFNGEIYNYIEIREELKSLGSVFKTHSDTEVLLEAYRVWGADCQNKFNGMWAFCVWDNLNKKIFISTDRFGVKSFNYISLEDSFVLGSEIKQFSIFKDWNGGLNMEHLKNLYQFGLLDIDHTTPFNNIERFKKSHCCTIKPPGYNNTLLKNPDRYYTVKKQSIAIDEKAAIEHYQYLLQSAVSLRMRSDVKFGFALSGGVDSSSIIYTAKNILTKENRINELIGFSAIFPGHEQADESKFVKIIVDDLKLKAYDINPYETFTFEEFEKHVYHQDEPLLTTSYFAQWSVYSLAKQNGIKVLLNGQGADEVFAGYHHHFYRYVRYLLTRGKIREYFSLVKAYCNIKGINTKHIHKLVFNEIKLSVKIKTGIKQFDHSLLKHWNEMDTLDEMLLADFDTYLLPTYLRADDRDSMAFSIESRHPFMDYRMVEFGYSLPNTLLIKEGWQKFIMRKAMPEMPTSISFRKDKKGFTTPEKAWLKTYEKEFQNYLQYDQKTFGTTKLSNNEFYNYSIGAWLKVNESAV